MKNSFTFILLGILLNSCCLTIKEEYLGNNLYLSEYDNVDRRILYSTKSCSGSGVELVPMTVLEYSYNSKWIIAKSGSKGNDTYFEYWIIKNDYQDEPGIETIKVNTLGPLDFITFNAEMNKKEIALELKRID